jgi:hypothetical protein
MKLSLIEKPEAWKLYNRRKSEESRERKPVSWSREIHCSSAIYADSENVWSYYWPLEMKMAECFCGWKKAVKIPRVYDSKLYVTMLE